MPNAQVPVPGVHMHAFTLVCVLCVCKCAYTCARACVFVVCVGVHVHAIALVCIVCVGLADGACTSLARGIDRNKSLTLLDLSENRQVREHIL